jgi:hypothetical protein
VDSEPLISQNRRFGWQLRVRLRFPAMMKKNADPCLRRLQERSFPCRSGQAIFVVDLTIPEQIFLHSGGPCGDGSRRSSCSHLCGSFRREARCAGRIGYKLNCHFLPISVGNRVEHLYPPEFEVLGLEFAAMASGQHSVSQDVLYVRDLYSVSLAV